MTVNNDTYATDHICYLNEINRANFVCFLILQAQKIVRKTFLFQNYENIKFESSSVQAAHDSGLLLSDPKFPQMFYSFKVMEERSIDNFFIGTFFELIVKALLINNGYIIHEIKIGKDTSSEIRSLKEIQRGQPILIDDYLRYESFQDHKKTGRLSLPSLTYKTLDNFILLGPKYVSTLSLDEQLLLAAQYFRIERNMIHFLIPGVSENQIENKSLNIDIVPLIKQFDEERLIPTFTKLCQKYELNYPNI